MFLEDGDHSVVGISLVEEQWLAQLTGQLNLDIDVAFYLTKKIVGEFKIFRIPVNFKHFIFSHLFLLYPLMFACYFDVWEGWTYIDLVT